MLIFISGPLTDGGNADTNTILSNMENAVLAGIECIKKGHSPFIPHLNYITHRVAEEQDFEIPYDRWMAIDDDILQKCDAVLFIGSSKGSETELLRAKEFGLPVFFSVDELPVN